MSLSWLLMSNGTGIIITGYKVNRKVSEWMKYVYKCIL